MPGFFGTQNAGMRAADVLRAEFLQCWPESTIVEHQRGIIGGHAFTPFEPLFRSWSNDIIAIDGEWSLYEEAARDLPAHPQRLFQFAQRSGGLETPCVGTIAVVSADECRLLLATDPTGTFPLYLCQHAGGLLYSSLLRPLARAVGAEPHEIAALEFLRQAYTVGDKTLYRGIRRLLPGQAVLYNDGRLTVIERSEAWTKTERMTRKRAAAVAWGRLVQSMERAIPQHNATLMMSGGWDSRTLLAAATATRRPFGTYAHGDTTSRELQLARSLSHDIGVDCHLEPIDLRILDPALLEVGFRRTENLVFPHWHRAGRLLAERGVSCVFAGVYGEILGGHYGPAMLMASPLGKMSSVASLLLVGRHFIPDKNRRTAAIDFLRLRSLPRHWYLRRDYEMSLGDPLALMNEDIKASIGRLERRGVSEPEALIEAFISENRGTQHINAQLRSVRAWTNVAAPFAGGEIFTFATRVPIGAKVHNSLNKRMIASHTPLLLRRSMAATLVPASAPILMQEASRAVRKALQRVNCSYVGQNVGWVNFEFLRGSHFLQSIIEELRSDRWDKKSMYDTVKKMELNGSASMHPLFDQFAKILTVDYMFR